MLNPPNNSPVVMPFSLAQQSIWIDQLSYPNSPHFNIGGIGYISGQLNIPMLEQALGIMVGQNQALRLQPLADGQQQLVSRWPGALMEHRDHSGDENPEGSIKQWVKQLFIEPIRLGSEHQPWKIILLKQQDNYYAMVAKCHHLVLDGYSLALIFRRWSVIYNGLLNGQSMEEDTPSYQQFIEESTRYVHSSAFAKDADYWRKRVPTIPATLLMPMKTSTTSQTTTAHHLPEALHHYYAIEPVQFEAFEQFSKSLNCTTFHYFIAAVAIYCSRIYNQDEVVIGIPVLNRAGKRYKNTFGMFVGMFPLCLNMSEYDMVAQLMMEINQQLRRSYRHARYPLTDTFNRLDMMANQTDRLFDVVISYEIQVFSVEFGEASLSTIQQMFSDRARYPLSLSICEFHDNAPLEVAIESSSAYFTAEQINMLGKRLHYLMCAITADPSMPIQQLPVVTDVERQGMIYTKHAEIAQLNNPLSVIASFEHQAKLRPQASALSSAVNNDNDNLNYQQLNARANRLACHLLRQRVRRADIVAVIMPRCPETIIAFLAILKSRACFMPIDPQLSPQRIDQLVALSGCRLAIVDGANSLFNQLAVTTIEAKSYQQTGLCEQDLADKPTLDDLAYLLYTSGSTGEPKGVLIEHGALARRIGWVSREFQFSPKDIWLQSIQLTFDPAMLEIFLPLARGATLALAPPGPVAPTELAALAQSSQASCMIFVPTTLTYFNQVASQYPQIKLRMAICGGEILHRKTALQFTQVTNARLYNFYGPTEATIFASVQRFDEHDYCDPLSIGCAVDDTRIYILDKQLQPLPALAIGEIYIGGSGLARGYLNNPEANQRFIDDPFMPGMRLYCSGDNGYWGEQGELHFVGRIDNQLKIHGQRLEPAEIESALCTIPAVKNAAVKKHQGQLHAWLQLHPDKQVQDINDIASVLLHKLPSYMVPSAFTLVAEMPQQSSGKTDYAQLKAEPIDFGNDVLDADQRVEISELENHLITLWQQTLNNPQLGLNSGFFTSGGNSIAALTLLEKIDKQVAQRLPLSMLLTHPTPKTLATALLQQQLPILVNLSQHELGSTIYLAASGHGDAVRFLPLIKALGKQYNVQMLQPPLLTGYTSYHSIPELAQFYSKIIAAKSHTNKPIIAGFSVAGISALETAKQLVNAGVDIEGLVMIDTTFPHRLLNRPLLWRLCRYLVNTLRLQQMSINQRTLGSLFNDPGLHGQVVASRGYQPAGLPVKTILVISSGFNRWYRLLFKSWQKVLGNKLQQSHLDGFHGTLFDSEHVDGLAEVFRGIGRNK